MINIDQIRGLQEQTKEHTLDQFISLAYQENLDYHADSKPFSRYGQVFSKEFQENYGLKNYVIPSVYTIDKSLESCVIPLEISLGKLLYINLKLDLEQKQKLTQLLQKQSGAFAWEYENMRGIHPDTYIHHIYTQENVSPTRQPQ